VGVLLLSQYVEPSYAMRLIQDHPERVGYLLKERVFDAAILVDALRRIAEGECVIDPTIVSRLVGRRRREDPLSGLTEREREVLALVAEGLSNLPSPTACSSPSGRSRPTPNRSSGSWDSRQIPPPTDGYSPCWPSSARQSPEASPGLTYAPRCGGARRRVHDTSGSYASYQYVLSSCACIFRVKQTIPRLRTDIT
jgi:hypothetical protein